MRVAIIAGDGNLPVEIAKTLISQGELPVSLTVCSDPEKMADCSEPVLNLGKLKLSLGLKLLKENNVDRVIMAGTVSKRSIYTPSVLLDPVSLKIFMRSRKDDHSLLGAVVSWFESEGIKVLPYASYVARCLAPEGLISARAPSGEERKDIEYGKRILVDILRYSFGQSLVVADEAIVAIEAMEGTDGMIKRSGELLSGKMAKRKGTVVKMMRADQDERYDLPTIGPDTIENMHKAGLTCIAIESERTLVLEYDKVLEKAKRYDIAILGIERQVTNYK
ncbi:MAG: UDP-2,3-diacylglucosamine diphosphatase LpxI [Synergistaceae bacterium]|nr:UDP-2,3-diacylglucosamine diphosphatase LpxI [Synergistaceae bacterium]